MFSLRQSQLCDVRGWGLGWEGVFAHLGMQHPKMVSEAQELKSHLRSSLCQAELSVHMQSDFGSKMTCLVGKKLPCVVMI